MKNLEFPIIGSKTQGVTQTFDLADIEGRKAYFQAKVGTEITEIAKYLETNSFMAFFLGKKNAGKGTYSGLLREIFGTEKIATVSVGDLVREIHANWDEFVKSEEYANTKKFYRGFISFDEAVERLHSRSTTAPLLPSEFILALLKARLASLGRKAVFIDGLPRDIDQISYSLFFRDLANYRDDPDFFLMIDIPMSVIDERIKYRRICPKCNNSRNMKLLVTKDIEYDKTTGEFHLLCDNPSCNGIRMVPKEGDALGITPIRHRLEKDEEILRKVFELHGVPKVLLRNHIPAAEALSYYDDYELTPEYIVRWSEESQKVTVEEKPWTVKDDNDVESYSLLAPAVVVSLIKQLADVLELL